MNKGTYMILIEVPDDLKLKKPKEMILKKGYYIYVGSAMNSLTGRLKRHLVRDKKLHWHVDQLTSFGEVVLILAFPNSRSEREISEYLSSQLDCVPGFGSTDLPVKSNLFRVSEERVAHVVHNLVKRFWKIS